MRILLPLAIIFCFLASCQNASSGLRKLEDDEIIDRVKNNALYNQDIVFKSQSGETISRDSLFLYNPETFFADYYVDESGTVKEIVLRKVKPADRELMERIKEAGHEAQRSYGPQ